MKTCLKTSRLASVQLERIGLLTESAETAEIAVGRIEVVRSRLCAVGDAQLAVHRGEVKLDHVRADVELRRDLAVRQTVRDALEDFGLTRRQHRTERMRAYGSGLMAHSHHPMVLAPRSECYGTMGQVCRRAELDSGLLVAPGSPGDVRGDMSRLSRIVPDADPTVQVGCRQYLAMWAGAR